MTPPASPAHRPAQLSRATEPGGRAAASAGDLWADDGREPLALAATDWLRHQLTISGPAAVMAQFRHVAQGTNCAPWHLDLDHAEASPI